MNIKRTVLNAISIATAAFAIAGAGTANADTFRLTMGAGTGDGTIWVPAMRDFFAPEITKRVQQKTGHKIEWVNAFAGSVCKLGECLEAVETGLLDIGAVATPFEPAKLMAHNYAFYVPFGTPDPAVSARAALKVYDAVPDLKKILDKYNQVFLGVISAGNYGLLTMFPWDKVEQLKGRKIAAAGPNIPWLQAVGAIGVQSGLTEAYTSLQSGVYEGWVMFSGATVSFKLHEVAKNYTITNFGSMANSVITINKDTWRKLPKPVQDIMLEVGKEYVDVVAKRTIEQEQRGIDTMKATGVNVRTLSEAERAKWANALPDIPNQRVAELKKAGQPGEVIGAYLKILQETGVKLPRDWQVK